MEEAVHGVLTGFDGDVEAVHAAASEVTGPMEAMFTPSRTLGPAMARKFFICPGEPGEGDPVGFAGERFFDEFGGVGRDDGAVGFDDIDGCSAFGELDGVTVTGDGGAGEEDAFAVE